MKNYFFGLVFILCATACEPAGTGIPIDIPTVQVNCTVSKCTSANGTFDLYVNITLSGCAADQIELSPVANASGSVFCGPSGCTGSVSSWSNSNGAITQIESGTYSVCGWIDLNAGILKDSQDAFSEVDQFVSESTITLSDWGASNFSRRRTR